MSHTAGLPLRSPARTSVAAAPTAVRPALGIDLALRLLLDPVIADRRSRVQPLVDVLLGQLLEEPLLHGVGGPDPCVAVRLELERTARLSGPWRSFPI